MRVGGGVEQVSVDSAHILKLDEAHARLLVVGTDGVAKAVHDAESPKE